MKLFVMYSSSPYSRAASAYVFYFVLCLCLRPLTLQAVYPFASVFCLFRKFCRRFHALSRLLRFLHYGACAQNKGWHSFLLLLLWNVYQSPVLGLQTDHLLQTEKSSLSAKSVFQDNSENSIFSKFYRLVLLEMLTY